MKVADEAASRTVSDELSAMQVDASLGLGWSLGRVV